MDIRWQQLRVKFHIFNAVKALKIGNTNFLAPFTVHWLSNVCGTKMKRKSVDNEIISI